MKALFIGGTGTISMAITRLIASDPRWELYLVNRGRRKGDLPSNVRLIEGDVNNEEEMRRKLGDTVFDTVCDFIAFVPAHLERDRRLFEGRTRQYMCISSASAYQKPLNDPLITESTPLHNPYWEYSRNKIAMEDTLMRWYREEGFPVTIIRPSHTYDERSLPVGVHGDRGSWQVVKRIMEGRPVIIHGDGTSLWTVTHNSDFARGFAGLMGNPRAIGEAFHITSDESLTWDGIYARIAAALNVPLHPVHVSSEFLAKAGPYDFTGSLIGDKANSVIFDNAKLKRAVPSFTCTVRFDQGVRMALGYILDHPECRVEDPDFDRWCDLVIDTLNGAAERISASFLRPEKA